MVRRFVYMAVTAALLCAMAAALTGCPGGGGESGAGTGGKGAVASKLTQIEPVALDKFVPKQDFWRPKDVEWRNFDAALFEEALAEDKPIFMYEGDSTSIASKMYAERIFAEEGIKEILAENYLCVWADRDRYPGLFERYQANNSETPAVLILHPSGPQLLSRTREDPDRVVDWLHIFNERWANDEDRAKYEEIAESAMSGFRRVTDAKAEAFGDALEQELPAAAYDEVLDELKTTFKSRIGDFIPSPRLVRYATMEFFVDAAMRDNKDAAEMLTAYIEKTLLKLGDPVDGGYFAMAFDGDFRDLDFTKRLDENARVACELARFYTVTGDAKHRDAAKYALDFMIGKLGHTVDGRVVGFGNRMENNPEYFTADASKRAGIPLPDVDPTIIAEYNFMAVEALVWAHFAIDDGAGYLDNARSVAKNMIAHMYVNGAFVRYASESPSEVVFLSDQVWAARALLTLYMATGDNLFIETVRGTLSTIHDKFWAKGGGLLDTPPEGPGLYSIPFWPLGEAAVASRAELLMHQMSKETGVEGSGEEHLKYARDYVAGFANAYLPPAGVADQSLMYALAVRENLSEPLDFHLVFSGAKEGESAAAVKESFLSKFPYRSIEILVSGEDDKRIGELGYTTTVPVAVFLCHGPQCVPVKPGEVDSKVAVLKRRLAEDGFVYTDDAPEESA